MGRRLCRTSDTRGTGHPVTGKGKRVQVQIVTHNHAEEIAECVSSARRQTLSPERILVIDNASADGCHRVAEGSGATVIRMPENRGYAAAHNLGFREALKGRACDFVLTLNPDARLSSEYLERCVEVLTRKPLAGGAMGKLVRTRPKLPETTAISEAGAHVPAVIDSAGLQMEGFFHVRDRGSGETDQGQFDAECEVWGVTGAAAVYRVEMISDLGIEGFVFDETFFAYKEDVDLCWTARRLGWSFYYVPEALCGHERGWKRGERKAPFVRSHSFVNQIALLVHHTAPGDPRVWAAAAVEAGRLGWMAATDWASFVSTLGLLRKRWSGMLRRRRVLVERQADKELSSR